MIIPQLEGRILTKAHGTGNDFLLVPDFNNTLDLDAQAVAKVCDRHKGVGADGFIRVVRTGALPEMAELAKQHPEAEWFMDYRNADGSLAEMCGNGVRVFVHYLRIQGIVDMALGSSISVATRGGIKNVTFDGPTYTVDMGEYGLPFGDAGDDTKVSVPGLGERKALSVTMPNPHTVVLLEEYEELESARLLNGEPKYDPIPAQGTNLELAVPGEVTRMRVLERGSGETLACGTGTCAVALAVLMAQKQKKEKDQGADARKDEIRGTVKIESPGGSLSVRIENGRAYLTGEAILVAEVALIGIAGYNEA